MSSKPSVLFRMLGATILATELFVVLWTVLVVGFFLSGGSLLKFAGPGGSLSLGEVRLTLPAETYTLTSRSMPNETVTFSKVRGVPTFPEAPKAAGYLEAIRWPAAITALFLGLGIALVCEWLRRIFRNVARGEAFTRANISNLHKIGFAVIALTLGAAPLLGWTRANLAQHMRYDLKATGLKMDVKPRGSGSMQLSLDDFLLDFHLTGLLAGVMVIALGEAFRQGLALKEDNDLTV